MARTNKDYTPNLSKGVTDKLTIELATEMYCDIVYKQVMVRKGYSSVAAKNFSESIREKVRTVATNHVNSGMEYDNVFNAVVTDMNVIMSGEFKYKI